MSTHADPRVWDRVLRRWVHRRPRVVGELADVGRLTDPEWVRAQLEEGAARLDLVDADQVHEARRREAQELPLIGQPHQLREHWVRAEPIGGGDDEDEDEWVRADGGRLGFSGCPDDTERVMRMDDYDRRYPATPFRRALHKMHELMADVDPGEVLGLANEERDDATGGQDGSQ